MADKRQVPKNDSYTRWQERKKLKGQKPEGDIAWEMRKDQIREHARKIRAIFTTNRDKPLYDRIRSNEARSLFDEHSYGMYQSKNAKKMLSSLSDKMYTLADKLNRADSEESIFDVLYTKEEQAERQAEYNRKAERIRNHIKNNTKDVIKTINKGFRSMAQAETKHREGLLRHQKAKTIKNKYNIDLTNY